MIIVWLTQVNHKCYNPTPSSWRRQAQPSRTSQVRVSTSNRDRHHLRPCNPTPSSWRRQAQPIKSRITIIAVFYHKLTKIANKKILNVLIFLELTVHTSLKKFHNNMSHHKMFYSMRMS